MPCQLAKQYIELCSSSENNIERVALVIDSRESVFGYNPLNTYDGTGAGLNVRTK